MNTDTFATFLVYSLLAAPLLGTAIGLVVMAAERKPRGFPQTALDRMDVHAEPKPAALMQQAIATAAAHAHVDVAQQVRDARKLLRGRELERDSCILPLSADQGWPDAVQVGR